MSERGERFGGRDRADDRQTGHGSGRKHGGVLGIRTTCVPWLITTFPNFYTYPSRHEYQIQDTKYPNRNFADAERGGVFIHHLAHPPRQKKNKNKAKLLPRPPQRQIPRTRPDRNDNIPIRHDPVLKPDAPIAQIPPRETQFHSRHIPRCQF